MKPYRDATIYRDGRQYFIWRRYGGKIDRNRYGDRFIDAVLIYPSKAGLRRITKSSTTLGCCVEYDTMMICFLAHRFDQNGLVYVVAL